MPFPLIICAGTDHPRIRGEHHEVSCRVLWPLRIIPAYAGSTLPTAPIYLRFLGSSPHTRGALWGRGPMSGASRDHPRIRGEHLLVTY